VGVARRIFGPAVLIACVSLAALALLAVAADPGVLPGPAALVFQGDQLPLVLIVLLFSLVSIFIHELAHLVAARAAGVPARMGVSHRLWFLVAETDMTGIWLASRRERCLAFLAGLMTDVLFAAVLIVVVFAQRHGWVVLDSTTVALARAFTFVYLTGLLWQCELFVPTDLYYVVATVFGCKSLMDDTQAYLLNLLARVLPSVRSRNQSALPPREAAVVRWFAVAWILGPGLAFAALF
jgi:hypothetical protein